MSGQSSWAQNGAHLGPTGPRWAPCWPHEPCYQGDQSSYNRGIPLAITVYWLYICVMCPWTLSSMNTWWRHQMETFPPSLALYEGNLLVTDGFPPKASDAEFWCLFDLRLNKRFSKHSIRRWFDMPSCPLWHHCNERICTLMKLCARNIVFIPVMLSSC